MKKLLILLPALLLACTAVRAETIRTENADEYISAISMTAVMSAAEDNNNATDDYTLLVQFEDELDDEQALLDIWDEYDTHTLIYSSPETAQAAYEYYTELNIPVCRNTSMHIGADDTYISYGPQNIGTDKFIKNLTAIYGGADNMPEVTVAVIDSGVDYNHPFLQGRVRPELGYDIYNNDNDPMDDHSHGTHVAGIIADSTKKNVSIIPIKATDENGSLNTIQFKAALAKACELNPDVVNISLSSDKTDSARTQYAIFHDLFDKLKKQGTTVCVCAGNGANIADYVFPAYMNDVIVAANHDRYNTINTRSSNYGYNENSVIDIAAPGTSIYSTVLNNGYAYKSGTSMSAPFISAAAALLKTQNLNFSPDEIEQTIKDNALPYISSNNRYYGTGRLYLGGLIDIPGPEYEYSGTHIQLTIPNTNRALNDGAVVTVVGSVFGEIQKLVPVDIPPTTGDTAVCDIPFGAESSYGSIKVYLWDSFENPQPLFPVTVIKAKN